MKLPIDLYDLGEFLASVQQAFDSTTGEFNHRSAPATPLELRLWADRLWPQWEALVAVITQERATPMLTHLEEIDVWVETTPKPGVDLYGLWVGAALAVSGLVSPSAEQVVTLPPHYLILARPLPIGAFTGERLALIMTLDANGQLLGAGEQIEIGGWWHLAVAYATALRQSEDADHAESA